MNGDESPLTLGSAVEQAANTTSTDSGRTAGADAGRTAGPPADKAAAITKPAYETPAWAKKWAEPARKNLEALYGRDDLRPMWEPIQTEFDKYHAETRAEFGKQGQEFGHYRQKVDPVWNILSKYEPQYRLQGMTLEQGVMQLTQAAEYLATNPDEALPWLAQTYAPKDAAAVIRNLSQAWGVDLGQMTADAPYVDPALQTELNALRKELSGFKSEQQMRQQRETEQMRHRVVEQVSAFEDAKNAAGELLYPHFRRVFEPMIKAVNGGYAQDLASAYKFAVHNDPELMQEIEAQRAEDARRKAIEEAKARSEEAEKALAASRNPGTKGRPAPDTRKKKIVLSEAIKAAAGG